MITWDEIKREKVIKEHGVDFARMLDVFDDSFALHYEDYEHSESERRWIVIGKSAEYGIVVLAYTIEDDVTRCITARRAERWMVRLYENQRSRY